MTLLFNISLLLAALLCSLAAGFLYAYAVVAMPGIMHLADREFIRAFQVMDGVIQNGQPLFILMWVGSVITLVIAAVLSIWQLAGVERLLLIAAALIYLFGVQLPTATINIPLNNELQTWAVATMDDSQAEASRNRFEPRWNRWNEIRTALACVTAALLLILLYIL